MRTTLARSFRVAGTGLHTGAHTAVTVEPGEIGRGISLVRSDLSERPTIRATVDAVVSTERRTVLGSGAATVSTIEHLFAVLGAHRIDDAVILVDGPELPQFDGSAVVYTDALGGVGVVTREGKREVYAVQESWRVEFGGASYEIHPAPHLEIDVAIEWDHPNIGAQSFRCAVTPETFDEQLASARTFGFMDELTALRRKGFIRGASPQSVIALSRDGIAHGDPLRWPDEFVRHKALDLVGDLALLGGPVRAKINARKPSHAGNVHLAGMIRESCRSVTPPELVADGSS